jgi:xanthosine utilization system XapX-like protein
VFCGASLFAGFLWLWLVQGEPIGAAIVLLPLLLAVTAPFLVRAGRSTREFDLGGLLCFALVLRFGFAYYRFQNAQDAFGYWANGTRLSQAYLRFDFSEPTGRPVPGTGGMRAVAGVVQIFVNNDYFGAFLVLTWLGFIGCWLLYRAFDLAVADGDRYRYARLIVLWPAMAFWPASLGKDAWMVFTIGVAAYGTARVYQRVGGGYTLMSLGLFGASFVRPHLALLALLAFVTGLLVGRRHDIRDTLTPSFLAKIVGLVLVLVIGSVLVTRTQRLLDIEDFSSSSIDTATAKVGERTSEGDATFTPANPRTPTGFFEATVTVLFRPFPNEAGGTEQLLGAAEGMVLLVLTAASARRLLTVPRRLRAQPYVMFALAFVLLWILAFGVIGNFGILARQRTQMLPFYFVLLSVPAAVTLLRPERSDSRPRAVP